MFFTLMKTQDWVKTSVLLDNSICPTILASGVSLSIIIIYIVIMSFQVTAAVMIEDYFWMKYV